MAIVNLSKLIPHRTPAVLRWLYPGLLWRVVTHHKHLYLTFDDGPVPGPTEFVLDVLSSFNAKATFFCIGDNVGKHPQIYRKVIDAGHSIGNHTLHHVNGWDTGTQAYHNEVTACDRQMQLPESAPRLFRPPYGKITRPQIGALRTSHQIVMWDVLTRDYDKALTPEACCTGAIRATRPGSIVLFHDSLKAEKNMSYALPRFLAHFAEQGFEFKALPS